MLILECLKILSSAPLQVTTELGAYFRQVASGSHTSLPTFLPLRLPEKLSTFLCPLRSPITPFFSSELNAALQFCWNTHEGADSIHYHMLWHLSSSSLAILLIVFNHIWITGNFPLLHETLFLPILIPNKSGILHRARRTDDPLAHFKTYITSAFSQHDSILAIFIDLEKVYDTTLGTWVSL